MDVVHWPCGRLRAEYRRYQLDRPLHWGWDFARECVRMQRRPLLKFDGEWVCHAAQLIRRFKLTGQESNIAISRRYRRRWQAIAEAHAIWQANSRTRWAIEARILAKQCDAEIAAAEHVRDDTVAAFEALFFNVRDKLKARGWINAYVLRQGTQWSGQDVARVWGFFGFNAGAVVLQSLLDAFRASGLPDYSHLATGWFDDFPPTCQERWMYWSIQSLLLAPVLSQEQASRLVLGYSHVLAAESLASDRPVETAIPPLDLSMPASANSVGLRAARRIS